MEQTTKYVIIITSLMTVKLTIIESKNDIKPKIERSFYQVPIFTNVCDIVDRRAKLHCYCDTTEGNKAKTADCWVFTGGITEEDPIWPSFSSQSHLESLMFNVRSDDALTFIPAKAIVRLEKLAHFSIQYGTIKTIPPFAFTNSSSLRQILLKSNKITNLERHSFSRTMMLSNLSLDDNQISELKRDVFFNLPNLHVLHLSHNNLSLIHEGCFKHLNNLVELKLDSNYISVVTKEMLEGLENLSRLNLRNNKLTMIGNLAFSDLYGLKELYLDNNAIEYISERAFGGLTQLRRLTLSDNRLTVFYEDILEDIRSLILLDLRNNLLDTITYETIRPVVENDKSKSVAIHLEGNPFNCDCRLSWVYAVRNDTKDNTLRNTLDKITCLADQSTDRHLNDQQDRERESINKNSLVEDTYEYEDYNEKSKINKAKKLNEMPVESLPCPKELMQSMEESYGLPIQNEIRLKSFSRVSKLAPSLVKFILLVMLFF